MRYIQRKLNYKKILLLICISWLFINILFRFIIQNGNDYDFILYILCVATLLLFCSILYILIKWKQSVFKIVVLFLVMFFLFLQGQVILNVFGLTTNGLLSNKFSSSQVIYGVLDVQLYLLCFLIGVSVVNIKNRINIKRNVEIHDKILVKAGFIIMLCSFPFELYVNVAKMYFTLTQGYASLYQDMALNTIPSAFKILSYFFMTGCFFVLSGSKRGSLVEKVSYLCIAINAILKLVIGYRYTAVVPLIMLLYFLTIKSRDLSDMVKKRKTQKIIKRIIVIGVILVIFIFPLIRETRNTGGLSLYTIYNAFSIDNYKNMFTTVNDMGKSLQTVIYTRELVPNYYPYRYGYSYLMNFTTILPNLFWDRHPAEVYGSLGRWLTKIVDHDFWLFGGSLGFSCVAEAYINFGTLGLILIGFISGLLLEFVEEKVDISHNALNYACLASVSIYLMAYSRGEFGDVVRGIFWYTLIPRMFYKIIRKKETSYESVKIKR